MYTITIRRLTEQIGVSVDTIRYYRQLGLLKPKQRDNGYYYYSPRDAMTILYTRELRGHNLSMRSIGSTFDKTSLPSYLEVLQNEEKKLQHTMAMAQLALERVVETKKYIEKGLFLLRECSVEIYQGATTWTLCPFCSDGFRSGRLAGWTDYFPFTYVAITISAEELVSRRGDEPYRINLGCGILEKYAKRFQLPQDENVMLHSAATYARICIAVKDPFCISPNNIRPLLECAEEKSVSLQNGIGARLIFVENTRKSPIYYFMFWCNVDS